MPNVVITELPAFKLYTDLEDDDVGRHVAGTKVWEEHVTAAFHRYIRPGDLVIDIGANIGFFSMLAASIVGDNGLVISVEPNVNNVRLLESSRRANRFSNVKIIHIAAGSKLELLSFSARFTNGSASHMNVDADALNDWIVQAVPLNILLPTDKRIAFIKIDIEGFEPHALGGMADRIKTDRPIITTEFSPGCLAASGGWDAEDYLRFLINLGYNLYILENDGGEMYFGSDSAGLMVTYGSIAVARQTCHIDLIAKPV